MLYGRIVKTRWPPWPLIGWDLLDFFTETSEWNSRKRKQDLNVLYQVCIFQADWKNKMATPASDWLRLFRLLLWFWNHWMDFNETWQEARYQRPTKFVFFGPMREQKLPPLPIYQKGGPLYSGAQYVSLWASCFKLTTKIRAQNTWQFNSAKNIFAFNFPPQLRRRAKLLVSCCWQY